MIEKNSILTILIMIILLFGSVLFVSDEVKANIIEVGYDKDYESISEALAAASEGDTILIYEKIYKESLTVDKSLEILAKEGHGVVIDGETKDYSLFLETDDVYIEGISVRNSDVGVVVQNSYNVNLEDVNISDVNDGVLIMNSRKVSLNNINVYRPILRGIRALNSSDNQILHSTVSDSGYHPGYLSDSYNTSIKKCIFSGKQGLFLYRSTDISLLDNHISRGVGMEGEELAHFDSHYIHNNTVGDGKLHYVVDEDDRFFTDKTGQLVLVNMTGSLLSYNSFSGVEVGILLVYSRDNIIFGNNLNNNFQGMVFHSSSDNTIYQNNFVNNTRQVYSADDSLDKNIWNLLDVGGNYWSDYQGEDIYDDKIGDTEVPHPSRDKGGGYNELDSMPLMNVTYRIDLTLYLRKGWNFISLSIVSPCNEIAFLFESIEGNYDKMILWDSTLERWLSYMPERSEHFNSLKTVKRGNGLWIHALEEVNLTACGMSPASTNIVLQDGWNMIGIPSRYVIKENTLPDNVTLIGMFNGSREYLIEYVEVEDISLEPNKGYLLKVETDEAIIWNVVWS